MLPVAPYWRSILLCPFNLFRFQRCWFLAWTGLLFFPDIYVSLFGSWHTATLTVSYHELLHPLFFLPQITWPEPAPSVAWHHGHCPLTHAWSLASFLFLSGYARLCTNSCRPAGMVSGAVTVPALKQMPCPAALGAGNLSEFSIRVVVLVMKKEAVYLLPSAWSCPLGWLHLLKSFSSESGDAGSINTEVLITLRHD